MKMCEQLREDHYLFRCSNCGNTFYAEHIYVLLEQLTLERSKSAKLLEALKEIVKTDWTSFFHPNRFAQEAIDEYEKDNEK